MLLVGAVPLVDRMMRRCQIALSTFLLWVCNRVEHRCAALARPNLRTAYPPGCARRARRRCLPEFADIGSRPNLDDLGCRTRFLEEGLEIALASSSPPPAAAATAAPAPLCFILFIGTAFATRSIVYRGEFCRHLCSLLDHL